MKRPNISKHILSADAFVSYGQLKSSFPRELVAQQLARGMTQKILMSSELLEDEMNEYTVRFRMSLVVMSQADFWKYVLQMAEELNRANSMGGLPPYTITSNLIEEDV